MSRVSLPMNSYTMVLLSASNAWDMYMDANYLWKGPIDIARSGANVVAGPVLLVLIIITR